MNVVKLDVVKGSGEADIRRLPTYYCTLCNNETFRAYADGRVNCANVKCGALMRNLFAEAK